MKTLANKLYKYTLLNHFNRPRSIFKLANKNFNVLIGKIIVLINKYLDNEFLTEDQKSIQDAAYNFAQNELFPNAADWDANKHFPKDVYRKAAELGFACNLKK